MSPLRRYIPGDPLITRDARCWRVVKVDRNSDRDTFLAQLVGSATLLGGNVDRLEWLDDKKSWLFT
jgi:hypothetical protein